MKLRHSDFRFQVSGFLLVALVTIGMHAQPTGAPADGAVLANTTTYVLTRPTATNLFTANSAALATAVSGSFVSPATLNGYFADPGTQGSFSPSAWRSDLGLAIGTDVQAYDATLTGLAATTFNTAGQVAYATGADTFATITTTAFGRSLWDDSDAGDVRNTLALASATSAKPLSPERVTYTVEPVGGNSSIPSAVLFQATDTGVINTTIFTYPTSEPTVQGGNGDIYPWNRSVWGSSGAYLTSDSKGWKTSVEFMFYGTSFTTRMQGGKQWLWVDDLPIDYATQDAGGSASNYYGITYTFPTAKVRRIRIWMKNGFGGVWIGPNDAIWKVEPKRKPRIIVVGDSFAEGTNATNPEMGMLDVFERITGFEVFRNGLGGTGYNNAGALGRGNYLDRVAALVALAPDYVLFTGGINDGTGDVTTNATALVSAFASGSPNTKVMFVGPFNSNTFPPTAGLENVDDTIQDVCTATGATFVASPLDEGWLTAANAVVFTSGDGIHPSQAGHDFLGARLAHAVLDTLGLTSALANEYTALSKAGRVAASGSTIASGKIAGRTSSGVGAIEEIGVGTSMSLTAGALNTVQDLRTSAAPTFAGLTLSGNVTVPDAWSIGSAGSIALTAGGTDENITLKPSGIGIASVESPTNQISTLQIKATNNSAHLYLVNTASVDGGSNDVRFYKGSTTEYARLRATSEAGSGGRLVFYTDNGTAFAERARIASSGNLLIGTTSDSGHRLNVAGGVKLGSVGTGLTNLRHGTATLTSGAVTVSDTATTANSRVFVNRLTDGGTVGAGYSVARSAGTSFTITSKDGAGATQTADTSTVAYLIVEP